jgi:nitrile hydratase accessory protein
VTAGSFDLDRLAALPRDDGVPVFSEPWEARAFALAVALADAGHFAWPDFSAALAEEIEHAEHDDGVGEPSGFYGHWLSALQTVCLRAGLVTSDELQGRSEDWRLAYLRTPHGQAVSLPRS